MSVDKRGWIPAWRKLFDPDHALAEREGVCKRFAWLDIVQMAAHEPMRRHGQQLGRGELMVALRFLAERWGWSKSKVERFLKRLKSETRIGTVSETPLGTIYRVMEYDRYAVFHIEGRDTKRDTDRDKEKHYKQLRNIKSSLADTPEKGVEKKSAWGTEWGDVMVAVKECLYPNGAPKGALARTGKMIKQRYQVAFEPKDVIDMMRGLRKLVDADKVRDCKAGGDIKLWEAMKTDKHNGWMDIEGRGVWDAAMDRERYGMKSYKTHTKTYGLKHVDTADMTWEAQA